MSKRLFTSESVTEGHPDKMCDQISDAILDAIISQDPDGRVACETVITTGMVTVMGEISTDCHVDIPKVVREVIRGIGYDDASYGFDCNTCAVITSINKQSKDIALGVDCLAEGKSGQQSEEVQLGAGDQGMVFGYACNETPEAMPMPIVFAHKLAKKLTAVRKSGELPYLRPDGKTQVTIEYEDDLPVRVDAVVVSAQHAPHVSMTQLKKDVIARVILPVIPEVMMDHQTKIHINPTGRFVVGGPQGDTGLTGRKIIVDTYGGFARHGGGAFSGKDPTKVDRSGAYAARHIAKDIVSSDLADRCEVQIAYAIGVANPVSISVDTFGTGKFSDEALVSAIQSIFDLRPGAIIDRLELKNPIYQSLAAYGHMGRDDLNYKWEREEKLIELRKYFSMFHIE